MRAVENQKIVAIMPIKTQNERLPGKNTLMLGDKPLLCHELDMLKSINDISETYVYCSDMRIQGYLPDNVSLIRRPEYLDLPESNFSQIFSEFRKVVDADIYIYAHATAPYIEKETVQKCIGAVTSGEYDSAFCAVKIQDFLWRNGKPMNFNPLNIPRSQDIDPIYRETSGVYVFTKEAYDKTKRRIGENPFICIVSAKEAIDINEPEDFEFAKALWGVEIKAREK